MRGGFRESFDGFCCTFLWEINKIHILIAKKEMHLKEPKLKEEDEDSTSHNNNNGKQPQTTPTHTMYGYLRYPFSTKKRFIFLTYNIIHTNTIQIQLSNSKYVCSKHLMLFFFTVALILSTFSKNLSN